MSDGDLNDSPGGVLEGDLHLLCAEEEALRRHRASMVTDLAPAEAEAKEDEGGGRGLVADELGQKSLGSTPSFSASLRRQKSGRTESSAQNSEALVVSNLPS